MVALRCGHAGAGGGRHTHTRAAGEACTKRRSRVRPTKSQRSGCQKTSLHKCPWSRRAGQLSGGGGGGASRWRQPGPRRPSGAASGQGAPGRACRGTPNRSQGASAALESTVQFGLTCWASGAPSSTRTVCGVQHTARADRQLQQVWRRRQAVGDLAAAMAAERCGRAHASSPCAATVFPITKHSAGLCQTPEMGSIALSLSWSAGRRRRRPLADARPLQPLPMSCGPGARPCRCPQEPAGLIRHRSVP